MRRIVLLLAAVAVAACQEAVPTDPSARTPLPSADALAAADVVPGHFIVSLRSGEDPAAVARAYGLAPRYVYRHALVGFAGAISEAARAGLLRDARVVRVEPDQVMHAFGTQAPAPSWGLDRVDQRALPLDDSYTYERTGAGVTAYIIDTGIFTSHLDFGGRASVGIDELNDGQNGIDCNGHGTHVSGTVGGTTYGIAKGVTLVAVRVLGCNGSGTTSGVIAGVDWVTAHHADPAVANMSLGGGASSSLDAAVQNSITAGVAYAIAAGNGNWAGIAQDACNYSPARVPAAMTVGATNNTDTKASWSNYGSCVDWFAPGVNITSDWLGGGTNTISGTSMATPHTTGVAALLLQQYPTIKPQALRDTIFAHTTKGVVTNSKSTYNHLLYSLTPTEIIIPPGPPTSLTASITTNTRTVKRVTLEWTDGATTVDIMRNARLLTTVANAHSYIDNVGKKASGTYIYKVCDAGSTTRCSNTDEVTF